MKDIVHNGGRRGWLRSSLILAALITVTALGLAACGSGSSSSATASGGSRTSTYERLLGYSRCMRSHGVSNYPDPVTNGNGIGISLPDTSAPQYQSASQACRSLAPPAPTAAQQHQMLAQQLSFARCMRSHGVPNFPDPPANGDLNLSGTAVDKGSPEFNRAMQACRSDLGSGVGGGQQLP